MGWREDPGRHRQHPRSRSSAGCSESRSGGAPRRSRLGRQLFPERRRVRAPRRSDGVPLLERVGAILRNPAIYRLADEIPQPDASLGGRPRTYPAFMWVLFEALLSVYGSARQVEAELSHPLIWKFIRTLVEEQFPDDPSLHLPPEPMRRHHYLYGRNRYLTDPSVQDVLLRLH